jgi:hypothetical protein
LASSLAEGAHAPVPLVTSTINAGLQTVAISSTVEILVKGALKTMFLAKLRLVPGALIVVIAFGASGLFYRASGQTATTAVEQRPENRPRSELEAPRRENQLLKRNLEVVLEKVRAQEAELQTQRKEPKHAEKTDVEQLSLLIERTDWSQRMAARGYVTRAQANADLWKEVEVALRLLRETRDLETRRNVTEVLEKTLKKLREQEGKNDRPAGK